MDQRKRMYRTLGCLAGAMTGTASLLAWIDPLPSPPLRATSQEELTALARSLVFDDVALRLDQWKRVEIIDGPPLQSAGVLLTAGLDRNESHFHVSEEGRLSRTNRWVRQLAPSNAPQTVRIEIAHDDPVRALPATQGTKAQRHGGTEGNNLQQVSPQNAKNLPFSSTGSSHSPVQQNSVHALLDALDEVVQTRHPL